MRVPEYMTEQIARRFSGRFRLRWSEVEQMYLYEQQVRRGIAEGFAPIRIKNETHRRQTYEDQVRVRDGYLLTMKIAPGTQTRCAGCNGTVQIPAYKLALISCGYCATKGRNVSFKGGFFPISDTLLEEMEKIDPDTGGMDRVMAAAMKAEVAREKEKNK